MKTQQEQINIIFKSVGMLADEYTVNDLKLEFFGDYDLQAGALNLRKVRLRNAILSRVPDNKLEQYYGLEEKLSEINRKCWDAQEVVMKYSDDDWEKYTIEIAQAAIDAQVYNAERNKIMREIDILVGEAEYSPFMKSYTEEGKHYAKPYPKRKDRLG